MSADGRRWPPVPGGGAAAENEPDTVVGPGTVVGPETVAGPDIPAGPTRDKADSGSVTPLVIGMVVCLLVLTAGVTAAGSAFLAGQRLQRLCDGAVAAAVGAVDPRRESATGISPSRPIAAAHDYLRVRGPDVGAVVTLNPQTVFARCSNSAPIAFGVVFGVPTLERTVTAESQPILRYG